MEATQADAYMTIDEMHVHAAGHSMVRSKASYFNGQEQDIMCLTEAREIQGGAGKWIVKHKQQISYVSPNLFQVLWESCHGYRNGQTLPDGSTMCEEKAIELSKLPEEQRELPKQTPSAKRKRSTTAAKDGQPAAKRQRTKKTTVTGSDNSNLLKKNKEKRAQTATRLKDVAITAKQSQSQRAKALETALKMAFKRPAKYIGGVKIMTDEEREHFDDLIKEEEDDFEHVEISTPEEGWVDILPEDEEEEAENNLF
jgi:hypothetical protein